MNLLVVGELPHGLLLPDGSVALDQIDDFRRQDEEAAVDPRVVADRLFLEMIDDAVVERQGAEPGGGRTPVSVANPRCALWNAINAVMSTSETPSP